MTVMMSRQTQNTMDNQKAGTIDKWKKLKEVFDTKWGDDSIIGDSAYRQDGDMRQITKDIRQTLYTIGPDGKKHTFVNNNKNLNENHNKGDDSTQVQHVNHAARVFDIYNGSLDAYDFVDAITKYFAGYRETAWIPEQIKDFMINEGHGATKEQVYEFVEDQLSSIDYD